ncbi:MAG: NADH-quinone oxidoreductase subunit L [Actinobacteria bacterium]|nr:MAG: NADH-quinone oxidoreductase subunit L [Actinomycetota bacterium]
MVLDASWLIPALPLAGFVLLLVFGRRLGDPWAGWLATAMTTAAFAVSIVMFASLHGRAGNDRSFTHELFTWLPVGRLQVKAGLLVDPLSITMALFITGVGALIHLYSVGYMHGDESYPRFFVYLNLFAFSMLVLVLADSFLLSFLGWEGVGACSYFLISFWFERDTAASAGKKAFVTNRVGDFGFMIAMFLMFSALGSLQYGVVLTGAATLSKTTATAIALLLFLGAVGKSAQLPLYVWLPDAMEGPTPVSALIHAATMVTAGVYLMCRISPILVLAPGALTIIATVGALTALFAATIACAQNDIKRVLAYSTISQLGYMFLAVGSGAYVAAVFHMVTHAFFKALLFLGAGSVIHGLHDEQDMKRMGNLRRYLPITSATFIVGWLAIAGIPPFAGFWSKDEILANAFDTNKLLWLVGVVTALLTAYYMSRQVFMVFYGEEREREHASEPHESPWTMTLPLVVLAGLSFLGGLLNLPWKSTEFLRKWLEPVFGERLHALDVPAGTLWALAIGTVVLGVVGIGIAGGVYLRHRVPEDRMEPLVLRRAWYVDAAYAAAIDGPGRLLSTWSAYVIDLKVVDGAVNGVGTLVRATGDRLRRVQTGYVRNYALGVVIGAVLVLGWVVTRVQLS